MGGWLRQRSTPRDGGAVGPIIQYLHTIVVTTDEAVLAITGGRFRATIQRPEAISPRPAGVQMVPRQRSRLRPTGLPHPGERGVEALQAVTSPHIETDAGKPLRRYRIGTAAKAWALGRPDLHLHDFALRLKFARLEGALQSAIE